jgi:Leucine-rich repeat (LRR) protein
MDDETRNLCAVLLQSLARMYISRKLIIKKILGRVEKIWDPRRNMHYYYDTVTDIASWSKPRLLKKTEIEEVAQTYLPDEAATMIIRQCLRRAALRRVRMLYQDTIVATFDEGYDATYYYNPLTGNTTWELPGFMSGSLNYEYDKLPLGGTVHVDTEESESDAEDSDLSIDSELARQRRRAKRKFPRSKVQAVVDYVEDNVRNGIKTLNLENCNISHRLTDRIWDLTTLETLNLSHNSITSVSSKIQYLIKIHELNFSHNKLFKLPKQIEDLTLLKKFRASHNCFQSFTGFLWKCMKLEELDFSFNEFERLPITVGNLELLKATKQWEVGIGVLKNLKILNLQGNLFNEWPEQLDRNSKLLDMNMSQNFLTMIPPLISKNVNLQVLDLSNNLIRELPTELYYLPIKRLILNNNCLEDLPVLVLPKATDGSITNHGKNGLSGIKMSHIVEVNLSYNKLSSLDFRVGLFEKAKKFFATDNNISTIHQNIGLLTDLRELNIARNKIDGESIVGVGKCSALTKLNFSYNCVDRLPDTFSSLRGLTQLRASDNLIKSLPDRLFANFPGLHTMELHNNQIEVLPMSMFAMRKIVTLDISFNAIHQAIPKQLEQFSLLETLYLNNNQITELPDSISSLLRLQVLEVDNNMLTRFPVTISRCKSLKRVTTAQNRIEIKPSGLLELPNLISWDVSWNHDMVTQYVKWEQKEKQYRRDVDIMSEDFFRRQLTKARAKIGFSDERKNLATIHVADENIVRAEATNDSASLSSSDTRKSEKKAKKSKKGEEKRRKAEEERLALKKRQDEEELKHLLSWQRKLKSHFETHLQQFSSSVYFREDEFLDENGEVVIAERLGKLDDLTHRATSRLTSIQFVSLVREMQLSSQVWRDPMLFLQNISDNVPDMTLLNTLDLGHRYQDAIETYEYIANEVMSFIAIMRTEEKKRIVKVAKARRRELFSRNSLPGSITSRRESTAGNSIVSGLQRSHVDDVSPMTARSQFDASPMTSRSQFGGMTSRTNTSEANALLDMALGEDGGILSARDDGGASMTSDNPLLGLDPEGKDLEDSTIHDVSVSYNEVTLERECVQKKLLVDFDALPSLPSVQMLGPTTSTIYDIAFECYYGLGVSLLYRVEKLAAAIRNLERRGFLPLSLLNVAHRQGDDFKDLVIDVYDDILELMKKKEENEKGSFLERKKAKMAAFVNASGADDVNIDEPQEEETDQPKERKKKRAKIVKVGAVQDKSEEEKRLRMEKAAAAGKEKYIGEAIDPQVASSCASYLYQHRRLLALWANKAFDSAAEMLKLRGWDVLAIAFNGEDEATVEHGAEHMRSQAMDLHFHRAKAFQYVDQYDKALREYKSLVLLCRGKFHRTAELEVVKVYLAKSDFTKARDMLRAYIETDVDHADIRYPQPFELLKEHYSLALLSMFVNCGCEMLQFVGFNSPVQTLAYRVGEDGCFEKPPPIKESEVWKVRNFKLDEELIQSKKEDVALAYDMEEREKGVDKVKILLNNAKSKYRNQVEWVRADMDAITLRRKEQDMQEKEAKQQ